MAVSSVANSETFKVTTPSDREIQLTRLFDAPRRLVYEAMTQPAHIRRWWGRLTPEHSVVECDVDLRVGGAWRFVGRSPQGDYAFYGVYRELAPPGRAVFTEIFAPFPDVESVVTSLLTEEGGKTRLTATVIYPSAEVRDMVIKTGMASGAAISYDRLEEVTNELQR
jgi:uncharacterized protein YndB with AHSA1/START domain